MESLWGAAWEGGAGSGAEVARAKPAAHNSQDFLLRYGQQWINEIVQTRMREISAILSTGNDDAASLVRQVSSLLRDENAAHMITQTEVTRAMAFGAMETYRQAGITEFIWVTEHDARVCGECQRNKDAGPIPAGTPFPSGAVAPPQHPRCRCALLPAME